MLPSALAFTICSGHSGIFGVKLGAKDAEYLLLESKKFISGSQTFICF